MDQSLGFVLKGTQIRTTREAVEKALEGIAPEPVRTHWVSIRGRRFPVRQAFAAAFGVARRDVKTRVAVRVLRKLGFDVYTARAGTPRPAAEPHAPGQQVPKHRFPYTAWMPVAAETQRLDLRAIELKWSKWHCWEDLARDDRGAGGVHVPEGTPGVYEAKVEGENERLTIGRASDLYARVKDSLVSGRKYRRGGDKIRANEDLSKVRVRWAVTDRPAAAEEELHLQHIRQHGRLPRYTQRT